MTYDPHRYAGMLQQGMAQLGEAGASSWQAYEREKRLNSDMPPAMRKYIQRLLKGEDPQTLAAEARNDPEVMASLRKGLPQQPAAQGMINSVGMSGGQPAVMPPGAFGPAPTQNPAPPALQPGQAPPPPPPAAPQSLGGFGGHMKSAAAVQNMDAPAPYSDSPPAAAPRVPAGTNRGLGQIAAEALAPDAGMGGPRKPLVAAERTPMQSVPMVGRTQMGSAAPGPVVPARPMPSTANASNNPREDGPRTWRDYEAIKDMLPTLEAAKGRQLVAAINADARVRAVTESNDAKMLIARMVQEGKSEIEIARRLVEIGRIEGQKEIAALNGWVALQVAGTRAGSAREVAGMRQSSGYDNAILRSLDKEAASLRSLIGTYSRADKLFMLPGLNITLGQAEQDLARIETELAKMRKTEDRPPNQGPQPWPNSGPGTSPVGPPPGARPAPTSTPTPTRTSSSSFSSSTTPGSTAKIKIRYKVATQHGPAGTVKQIDPAKFNPQVHEKI